MATIVEGNENFRFSSSKTIPLGDDIVTDSILLAEPVTDWVLQPSTVTGLDGAPIYTLQGSLSGDAADFDDILPDFGTGIDINDTIGGDTLTNGMFIRVKIEAVNNTTGSCELIIRGIGG